MDSSKHEIELSINSNITVGLGDFFVNNYRKMRLMYAISLKRALHTACLSFNRHTDIIDFYDHQQ